MPEYWALPGTLSEREIEKLLSACDETRYPTRNRAIVLLASDAGLTAREIAWLRRYAVETDDGIVGDFIDLQGKPGTRLKARRIPMARKGRLRSTIIRLIGSIPGGPHDPLILGERALDGGIENPLPGLATFAEMKASSIGYVMWKLAEKAKLQVAGKRGMDAGRAARRTFLVRAARSMVGASATARDVQTLAGHRSLESTQRFIEADETAATRLIGSLFDRSDDGDHAE